MVKAVVQGSPASKTIIAPGDVLKKIDGHVIGDVLDYKYYSYDSRLLLELTGADGKMKLVRLRKQEGADIGLEFETYLMDKQRSCANKCIFCFIDQLPDGMRETLYYKDDDARLSFLQGNYITLTNLSQRELQRMIRLRVSPVNVSVHTLDPKLRGYMLGSKNAGLDALREFAQAGITMNCQIVCCPGINDGDVLWRTMEGLFALSPRVNSVSVVPVGLTKHRQGLTPLRPFDAELAAATVRQVEQLGEKCLKKRGSRVFFCADELYIKAGLELPQYEFYEDFPQLENGVGMMRLLITEFQRALAQTEAPARDAEPFSVVTGVAAGKYLTKLLYSAAEKYGNINGRVYMVKNEFFGENIDVAGLLTGRDIAGQLSGRELGKRLLIPVNMLKAGEDVFLDDMTVTELGERLGVKVCTVGLNGAELLRAFLSE